MINWFFFKSRHESWLLIKEIIDILEKIILFLISLSILRAILKQTRCVFDTTSYLWTLFLRKKGQLLDRQKSHQTKKLNPELFSLKSVLIEEERESLSSTRIYELKKWLRNYRKDKLIKMNVWISNNEIEEFLWSPRAFFCFAEFSWSGPLVSFWSLYSASLFLIHSHSWKFLLILLNLKLRHFIAWN